MDEFQRQQLRQGFLRALPLAALWIALLVIGVFWVHAAWIFILAALFFVAELAVLAVAFTRAIRI